MRESEYENVCKIIWSIWEENLNTFPRPPDVKKQLLLLDKKGRMILFPGSSFTLPSLKTTICFHCVFLTTKEQKEILGLQTVGKRLCCAPATYTHSI